MALKKILLAAGGISTAAVAAALGLYWGGVIPGPAQATVKSFDSSEPYAKIAGENRIFDFGQMAAGVEQKHEFVVRNEGDVTLYIKEVKISCHCTQGNVGKSELAPGESTTVDVSWKPKKKDPYFQQTIQLITNDPRYADPNHFKLTIKGAVEAVVTFDPEDKWTVGAISEDQPTVVHGLIHSMALDSFKILGVVAENPLISGVATPLPKEELDRLHAKCGYDITVTMKPGIQVGSFKEKVVVQTDLRGGSDIPWTIEGERTGPYRIVPMLGADWSSKHLKLNFGKILADKGASAQLMMFVSGLGKGEELKFVDIKSDVPFLKFEITPSAGNADRDPKKYTLKFDLPPGSPQESHTGPSSAKIKVKTNHPKAEAIEFKVDFVTL